MPISRDIDSGTVLFTLFAYFSVICEHQPLPSVQQDGVMFNVCSWWCCDNCCHSADSEVVEKF